MDQVIINLAVLSPKPTGITTYAQNLFPYLQTLDPTLLIADNIPEFTCFPVPPNLTPEQGTKGHFDRLKWTQFQLPQIYQKLKANLLFSPQPEAPLYTNCRYIVTFHDAIPLRFPKRFSPLTLYHRHYVPKVLQQAQHIICNSLATAKDITEFYGINPNKVTPIPLAHDAQHFRPPGEEEGWGLGAGGKNLSLFPATQSPIPYFLHLGRQDPYKNLHRLISAFAELPNCRDYQLWLAGPDDRRYTPLLQLQAEELGIGNQVKFLNYVPYSELPKIIHQATALVFPSLWEGFGFPVLEAMACGTPVITSNLSSLPEVAGDAAILINPYKREEITTAMQTIATDEQLRSHLSQLGIARANQFSWEQTGKTTIEVLSAYL